MDDAVQVDCPYCGENLGFQGGGTEIDWSIWQHNGCAGRIARDWGVPADEVVALKAVMAATIAGSFVDFPGYPIKGMTGEEFRAFRSRLAAGHLLDLFVAMGYWIKQTVKPRPCEDCPNAMCYNPQECPERPIQQ